MTFLENTSQPTTKDPEKMENVHFLYHRLHCGGDANGGGGAVVVTLVGMAALVWGQCCFCSWIYSPTPPTLTIGFRLCLVMTDVETGVM